MNDAEERFVRRYAHLAEDTPLDRHAARGRSVGAHSTSVV
jgi:hypothetical protein